MTKSTTPPALRRGSGQAWRRQFLRELARSGNVASAARACGLDPTFPYQSRRRDPAFAVSWDRALAAARERLGAGAGGDLPQDGATSPETPASAGDQKSLRKGKLTLRLDEIVRNSKTGHPKVVRVRQGRWSAKVEAAFLAELTATANVNAAARAAGVTPQCVYLRRKHYPAFKAEWDAAVAEGFARIETLVVCAATATLQPEPLPERAYEAPQMSMDQAIKIWLTHRAGGPGAQKRRLGGMPRREPDIEEVRQEILRKVAAMERAGMSAPQGEDGGRPPAS